VSIQLFDQDRDRLPTVRLTGHLPQLLPPVNVHLTPELETLFRTRLRPAATIPQAKWSAKRCGSLNRGTEFESSKSRNSGRKSTKAGPRSNAARGWTEKSTSGALSEKNGSGGGSAHGHEAFKLSPEACQDIQQIWAYIAADSIKAARRVRLQILDARWRIAENPGIGHSREDLTEKPVRFWPIGSFLIVYNPARRLVEIVRVVHGARDVPSLL